MFWWQCCFSRTSLPRQGSFLSGACRHDRRGEDEESPHRRQLCRHRVNAQEDDGEGQSGRTHPFLCKKEGKRTSVHLSHCHIISVYWPADIAAALKDNVMIVNVSNVIVSVFCHILLPVETVTYNTMGIMICAFVFQFCATLGTTPSCAFDHITELGPICKSTVAAAHTVFHYLVTSSPVYCRQVYVIPQIVSIQHCLSPRVMTPFN